MWTHPLTLVAAYLTGTCGIGWFWSFALLNWL